jgi:hypothetical protein
MMQVQVQAQQVLSDKGTPTGVSQMTEALVDRSHITSTC